MPSFLTVLSFQPRCLTPATWHSPLVTPHSGVWSPFSPMRWPKELLVHCPHLPNWSRPQNTLPSASLISYTENEKLLHLISLAQLDFLIEHRPLCPVGKRMGPSGWYWGVSREVKLSWGGWDAQCSGQAHTAVT